MCGAFSISWRQYFDAAKFLIFEQFIENLDIQASKNMVSLNVRNVLRNYINGIHDADPFDHEAVVDAEAQQIAHLSSCLTDINQLGASDPRDKVYGLYALYTGLGVPLPPVDYGKSVASVYTDATIAMISWSKSLRILGDACSPNRDPTLPSWVPDWNDAEERMFIPTRHTNDGNRLIKVTAHALFSTPGKISVKGKHVGRVAGALSGGQMILYPTRSGSDDVAILRSPGCVVVDDMDFLRLIVNKIRFFRELLRTIQASPDLFPGEYVDDVFHDLLTLSGRPFDCDLFETWIDILKYPDGACDQSCGRAKAEDWKVADDANALQWDSELLCCCTIVASLLTNSITYDGKPFKSHVDILDLVKEVSKNLGDHKVITIDSRFNDHFVLGTSFRDVAPGDPVVSLTGAPWPVVLRPAGMEWIFIGPAFLQGSSNGDVPLEDQCADVREEENFVVI